VNLSCLIPGDILVVVNHAIMWIGPVGREPKPKVAHAFPTGRQAGVVLADWDDEDVFLKGALAEPKYANEVTAFRLDPVIGEIAARFASSWCNPARPTPYGEKTRPTNRQPRQEDVKAITDYGGPTGRAQGVIHENGARVPFEFDALYRALKWAARVDSPLSQNRGITCAPFVVACYHAAAIHQSTPSHRRDQIAQTATVVKGWRAQKPILPDPNAAGGTVMLGMKSKYYPNAFREFSNAGPQPGHSLESAWQHVCDNLFGCRLRREEVFSPGLLLDAKFTSYKVLAQLDARSGWYPLHPLTDDLSQP
jgi:hypothetical protein